MLSERKFFGDPLAIRFSYAGILTLIAGFAVFIIIGQMRVGNSIVTTIKEYKPIGCRLSVAKVLRVYGARRRFNVRKFN